MQTNTLFLSCIRRLAFVTMLLCYCAIARAEVIDRVLVIVNEDVITKSEFDHRMSSVLGEAKRNNKQSLPEGLDQKLLDEMVAERLQIQEAERRGIEVSDAELQASLERFAAQQSLTIGQLGENVETQGQSFKRFSESVRESLIISRLTDYYARVRVIVPDYEIDGFIAQNKLDDAGSEYQISHILIKNPEQKQELAEQVLEELRSGMSFEEAVLNYSEATDAQDGGLLGWRSLDQLPEIFAQAIKTVDVGGVTDVLSSANGLHILKLLSMKGDREEVLQSKVRHILIASTTRIAQSQASKKLFDIRQRIVDGENFSQLARIYSDDSVSAANGGELGWVSPGEMVQPFEQAFEQLALSEVSQPVATQYGVHIIEVLDRRKKNITDQMIRGRADNILRRRRAEREFQQWVRELKEQAYIEYVSKPA